jgi:hypothetical protein
MTESTKKAPNRNTLENRINSEVFHCTELRKFSPEKTLP